MLLMLEWIPVVFVIVVMCELGLTLAQSQRSRVVKVSASKIQEAAERFANSAARYAEKSTMGDRPSHISEQEFLVLGSAVHKAYFDSYMDAYTTGAIEALKMDRGDFSPEPWFNERKTLAERMKAIPGYREGKL